MSKRNVSAARKPATTPATDISEVDLSKIKLADKFTLIAPVFRLPANGRSNEQVWMYRSVYKGKQSVRCAKVYENQEGEWCPTREGFSVSLERAPEFFALMASAQPDMIAPVIAASEG
jgi:hypothetical protein